MKGCSTRVFFGAVILSDMAQEAFLEVQNETYLMMLDEDCSGLFDPRRAAEAYQAFRTRPGQGGRLTCRGFLRRTGTRDVLHVVALVD